MFHGAGGLIHHTLRPAVVLAEQHVKGTTTGQIGLLSWVAGISGAARAGHAPTPSHAARTHRLPRPQTDARLLAEQHAETPGLPAPQGHLSPCTPGCRGPSNMQKLVLTQRKGLDFYGFLGCTEDKSGSDRA